MLTPPPGVIVPNVWAKRRGLSLAATFGGVTARPHLTRGAVEAAFAGGSAPGLSAGVVGMTGTAGYWQATGGTPTYSLATDRGTVVMVARSAAASGGGVRRYLFATGALAGFPANPFFGATDFDNVLYVGWANAGSDSRLTTSTAGGALWSAGDTIVIALVYGAGGQKLYVNGIEKASNAFATFGSTAAGLFSVGQLDTVGVPWLTATGDAIYSTLAFDTELTPSDIAALSADPWLWARLPPRTRRAFVGAAPTTWLGVFHPDIIAQAWFDPVIRPIGWWDRDLVDAPSVGGDVTVALTGQAATFAQGTVAPSTTVPIAGQAATFSQGSVAPRVAVPLGGQAATFAQGDVTPSRVVQVTGQVATFEQGAMAPALSAPLSGQAVTFAQGDVAPSIGGDVTVALTGQVATFAQGVMTSSVSGEAPQGPVGGDDAPASSEDVRRLSRRERRLRRDEEARGVRLRETLERAYRAATGGDEAATAEALADAAAVAPEPVREQIEAMPGVEDIARTLSVISKLLDSIQRKKDVIYRDDDELAVILSVF